MTRREWIVAAASAVPVTAVAAEAPVVPEASVRLNDGAVAEYLRTQLTDGPWRGSVPDQDGLCTAAAAGSVAAVCVAALVSPGSRYYGDDRLTNAIRLAMDFLVRSQTADGDISLLTTNFNSPPDTGFVVWGVAEAASVARRYRRRDLEEMLRPFLIHAASGLVKGGVHTPNHRWVVSSALAQVNALWPEPAYTRRIDQWLAEGIDIDPDGQYTERSTSVYNTVCDRAFVVLATKLHRPELLDPVRRNLDSMLYMLHPGYEVVTEISRRQDANQRATMARYWYPLAMLGMRDRNGQYWTLAKHFELENAGLITLLDNPELLGAGPEPKPVPDDYHRHFASLGLVRVRRGLTSASVLLSTSRFFTLRHGGATIEAVRFASAFFGKGQFVPGAWERQGTSWVLRQDLESAYYQPINERVAAGEWGAVRRKRATSEVCRLRQMATVTETSKGFRLRLQASGTDGVPLAVEIGLREGGRLSGCQKIASAEGAWLLGSGEGVYEAGGQRIRFGPGTGPHRYVQIRGTEPKLPGECVYLTGYTPFDHTIEFSVAG